ncbi:MAG: hypothetical protein U1E66_05475 [Rhodospirillales bacterium]
MEMVKLPCGRRARVVPGDEAGEFRFILIAPSLADRLGELGCDRDECDAAEHLANEWRESGMERYGRSVFAASGSHGGMTFEDGIRDGHWRAYGEAMAAMRPDHAIVAAVVIEGRSIAAGDVPRLRMGLAHLAAVLRKGMRGVSSLR